MKNIAISLGDGLCRQACIKAAEQPAAISALFRAFFISLIGSEGTELEFQRLQREEEELRAEMRSLRLSLNPAHNLNREELRTRHALHEPIALISTDLV